MNKKELHYCIYTDFYRVYGREMTFKDYIKLFFNYNILKGFRVLYFYRHCNFYYVNNIRKNIIRKIWQILFKHVSDKYNVEISENTRIGKGFVLYHAMGIVLHPNTEIGDNCTILQQVTIGNNHKDRNKVAVLGNNVSVGAGAKIIGPISIGDNVAVGANAVVTHDCESNSTVGGIPAKVITQGKKTIVYNSDYLCYEEWLNRRKK